VQELASNHGGPVPVRRKEGGALIPDGAIYRIVLVGQTPLPGTPERIVGNVVIDAPARSVLSVVYHRAVAVLMREASP
jgi:hypothetical protein